MSSTPETDQAARTARRDAQRRRRTRRRVLVLAAVASAAAAGIAVGIRSSHTTQAAAAKPAVVRAPAPRHLPPRTAKRVKRTVAKPLPVTEASRTAAVPILMYHVIAPAPADAPYPGLYVMPDAFAAQVHALVRAGFHAVTLDQVRAAWHGTAGLPPRPIVLTFDNGYRSQYTEALPILRRAGWVADENLQLTGLPPRQGGLTTRQIRALVAAGWELDTQGYNHADLTALDSEQLRFQIAVTRQRLRKLYGVAVSWFCYPSGRYDQAVVDAVRAAGFVGATTVVPGWAQPEGDAYTLPRLRVLGGTTPDELLAQIANARGVPPPVA
jgi:peptidoglycan/xylan/chitin deacetylase (PgdA/CDA1 family)